MSVKLTNADVDARLEGRNISRLGDYNGMHKHMYFKCCKEDCGWEWKAKPQSILNQMSGCPRCAGVTPKPHHQIDSILSIRGITRISEYTAVHDSMKFVCKEGHVWCARYSDVVNKGSGCPECSGKSRLSYKKLDSVLSSKNITRTTEITKLSNKSRIGFKCRTCSHEWIATPNNLISKNSGCPKCAGKAPLTEFEIDRRLSTKNIKRLSDFSGYGRDKMLFGCKICGGKWLTTVKSVVKLHGTGCPICAKSGFNPSESAIVYVYSVNEEYCGYGITNKFNRRNAQHNSSFKKSGAEAKLVATYECSGIQAQEIEKLIQKTFPIVNTGIDGFRREATHLHNLPAVLDLINNYLVEHKA